MQDDTARHDAVGVLLPAWTQHADRILLSLLDQRPNVTGKGMTDDQIIVLGVLTICLLGVCALCWRMIGGLHGHHALDAQGHERERRDYIQMIERLLEKRETPDRQQLDLAQGHRSERMHRTQIDAQTEVKTAETNAKQAKPKRRGNATVPTRRDEMAEAMFK